MFPMPQKTAHDFDQELLILFDAYVHGAIDRRAFLDKAAKFAVGGVTAAMLLEQLSPRFAEAQVVRTDDSRIEPQYLDPEPVRVHRSVLDWLRAGCSGLVPLSSDRADLYRLLSDCHGGIVAADDTHARDLRRALSHPWQHPAVEVADGAA